MIVGLASPLQSLTGNMAKQITNKTSIPQKLNASLSHLNLDNDSLKS